MSNVITKDILLQTLKGFQINGDVTYCEPYGFGHINSTQLVVDQSGKRYIFQKISERAFKDVPALMENIDLVTSFLREKSADPRTVLTLVYALDGSSYVKNEYGYWRVYDFVEDTICLQSAETDMDFYESAIAFGRFQQNLNDFPVEKLHETIPNFHNTPDRFRIFREVLAKDPLNRAKDVQAEIDFIFSQEEAVSTAQRMLERGELPARVTHNDTKLNNVLLDAATRKALCVIDLDTVMPGLSIFDFGDSIRFGAATAAEDEKDLSKVTMSLDRFRVYTRGFVQACPGLTDNEISMLPMGARTMTLECGMRFLTDYIDGDHYFAVHREGHNLDRCRTQLKLVRDMESKWGEMHKIIAEEKA
ncbi:MAG: aminoglycoside phosphotransferase family protein [Ruminococcaceae bacterium]|nr:aminoglycoside phosphotransferase family protein [Oscillospiraceae bacterium]